MFCGTAPGSAGARAWAVIVALGLVASSAQLRAASEGIHPRFPLKDAEGQQVQKAGTPIDVRETCGGDCHDIAYIERNSYHARSVAPEGSSWDLGPAFAERFAPLVHRDPAVTSTIATAEERWVGGDGRRPMNCVLCHVARPNYPARSRALRADALEWEVTATLEGIASISAGDRWRYEPSLFDDEGLVVGAKLGLTKARSSHCLACHGGLDVDADVAPASDPPSHLSPGWATGLAYSARSMNDPQLGLEGAESLDRPFDVHAERLIECSNCHHSINNPVYRGQKDFSRAEHLRFEARAKDLGNHVRRPSHELVTGRASQSFLGQKIAGSMRRCEDCHAADTAHDWLPYRARHFHVLTCETCHVPRLFTPVLELVDWTVLTSTSTPRTVLRTASGAPGFRPVWLERAMDDDAQKVGPHNLVTSFFWVGGQPETPVSLAVLRRVWFDADGRLRARWIEAFDTDGDGALAPSERALRTEVQVRLMKSALEAEGISTPRIEGELRPFGLHHGVAGKGHATKDCQSCHAERAELAAPVRLATTVPPGVTVAWRGRGLLAGSLEISKTDGALYFRPEVRATGLYVLGLHRFPWVDEFGVLVIGLVMLAALSHAIARVVLARRRGASR